MTDLFDPIGTAKFREFHADNPWVYRELVQLARQALERGRKRYGICALFELVRWHRMIKTTGDDFKLNNNHKPHYARLIMANEIDLRGFFETRELRKGE